MKEYVESRVNQQLLESKYSSQWPGSKYKRILGRRSERPGSYSVAGGSITQTLYLGEVFRR